MKNNKKTIIITSIILGVLILTISLTYAVFSMSKTGQNSSLVVGDVYMHYNEGSKEIKLENAAPSLSYDENNYFEFTIDGKNTYLKKDIYYEIVLSHGDEVQNKTRIKDLGLKFRLTEITDNGETELFTDRSFSDLTNKRIWVETIPKGTNTEMLKKYRLYMWLSNDIVICGGDETENCDYYIDKEPYWENIYASIKVGVNGDFEEKTLATDASCFTTELDYESATVNSIMASQTYQELIDNRNELSKCVDYFNKYEPDEGETPQDFCRGTGTFFGNTFQTLLDNSSFSNEMVTELKELNIITSDNKVNSVMMSQEYTELPDNRNELSKCMDYYKTGTFDDGSINETYCKGTGTLNGVTFQEGIDSKNITLSNYLIDNNIIKVTGQTATITSYSNSCEKDVVIPSSINGTKVVAIGGAAFGGKQLTSVIIPNTVINIMDREYRTSGAFGYNNLRSIVIPDSVIMIGATSFSGNSIESISIGNNVTTIGNNAFIGNKLTNVKLPSSLTSIGQYAFENNQLETFEIPNGLTMLTDFLGNNPLKSITFQENSKITAIGQGFISGTSSNIHEKYQILESIEIPNSITDIQVSNSMGPFNDLNLKEVIFEDNSKLTKIPAFSFNNLKLINVNIPNGVTEIGNSSFTSNQLTSVVIPNSVKRIGDGAFLNNQLASVTIPDSVTTIESSSFESNQLINLTIPDSVERIGDGAFSSNQLTSVTIGNGIQYIGNVAFKKSSSSNPNLSKITINKSCTDIKNIVSSSSNNKYYPWLSSSSPYTASGVTIYGSNNEVCDSY